LWRMNLVKMVYASGANAIAVPGWPLPAFCTASIASVLTVSMDRRATSCWVPRSKMPPNLLVFARF
jgi:hypothetical protein